MPAIIFNLNFFGSHIFHYALIVGKFGNFNVFVKNQQLLSRAPFFSDGGSSTVPEITTSWAPDDDDEDIKQSSAPEKLKDEEYVEKLATSLSRKLEKTRSKLQHRTSELSLIKASPDSKNPSVILSCASDDEEDVEKKPPVRDTLSADQPARSARLLRGLRRKLSKTKSGDEKGDSASKTGAEKKDDKASTSKHDSGNGAVAAGPGEEDDAVSALSSSPSPPVSEYEGSHRGSWSTLLHAIGTAEMVQKVQRQVESSFEKWEILLDQ